MPSTTRHLTSAALAIATALVLTACGGGDDAATSDSASHSGGGGHGATAGSTPSAAPDASATGNDADIAFLTGMRPHHEQAVEMSDLVLAADPPAPVAELARQVKAAQAPEISQMERMLTDLGHEAGGHHRSGGMMQHGGMMSEADMQELRTATGTDAARSYLEGMIAHHEGAIESAQTEMAEGQYPPAVELARQIAEDQAAEIATMERLLASL